MTSREAAVLGAYTGVLMGSFSDMHRYVEEILERPVMIHELGNEYVEAEIKAASRSDFFDICSNLTEETP